MTYIDTSVPIAAHAAVTTNVHGTGAGNVIVGDDELAGMALITTNTYSGNNTVNRGIAHGLGITPKVILINRSDTNSYWFRVFSTHLLHLYSDSQGDYSVTASDNTNFYIGNAANYGHTANSTGGTYKWWAFA